MTRACDCGNKEFLYVKDLNLDKVWKSGNKFCRVCTACGSRYFLAKSIYQRAEDQYVILDGENTPIPIFACPNKTCEETVTGLPDACPFCDVPYVWDDGEDEAEEIEADDEPATVNDVLEDDDPAEIEPDEPEYVDEAPVEEEEEPEEEPEPIAADEAEAVEAVEPDASVSTDPADAEADVATPEVE